MDKAKLPVKKYPSCPRCGTNDYDVNEDGTKGYCIVSCGAVFTIKNSKAKLTGEETHSIIIL